MTIEGTFNKYKRFLETIDVAKYQINYNGAYYRIASYNKFGGTKGYLVLNGNGKLCPRQEAVDPYKQFITFNSFLVGLDKEWRSEMKKPTSVFNETINLLHQIRPFTIKHNDSITKVILIIEELKEGYQRITDIHPEAMKKYDDMVEKGELDIKTVNEITELMSEFTSLQYKNLYLQIDAKQHFEVISKELEDLKLNVGNQDKKVVEKAKDVFKYLTEEKYQSGIQKSLRNFETDLQGQQISFYLESNWERKLIENINARNNDEFQKIVLPMLRN
jgi:hypothetical protein